MMASVLQRGYSRGGPFTPSERESEKDLKEQSEEIKEKISNISLSLSLGMSRPLSMDVTVLMIEMWFLPSEPIFLCILRLPGADRPVTQKWTEVLNKRA